MALEGVTPPTGRSGLPPLGTYFRTVYALGLGSLRAAPVAIIILYCFRLGMELILALTGDSSSPLGTYENEGFVLSAGIELAAYLPMLVLIYTPFLPLQDGLLRGERRSFFDCVLLVLERLGSVFLSVIAQVIVAIVPPALILGGIAAGLRALPTKHEAWQQVVVYTAMVPCLLWIGLVALFLVYAIPFLVLERRGPLTSIRLSISWVSHQFGGIFGRLLLFLCVLMLAAVVLSIPGAMLQGWSSVAHVDHPVLRILRAIWSAGVSAVLFPFTVAALMVLFRSSVPATGATPAGPARDSAEEPAPGSSPFRFE